MKEKQIKNFERNIKIAVAGLALVVVVLGICSFLQFTKPYAVTEDGTKVEEPWEVKIGDEKSFVVNRYRTATVQRTLSQKLQLCIRRFR